MTIIKEVENILKSADIDEYKKEAQILVCELSGLSLEEVFIDKPINNKEEIIETAKKRVQSKAPIQYLLGYSYFMGEKYKVNANVLIPRDETEVLVNHAFELVKNNENKIDILDIGTGSGCISCALAKKMQNKNIEILGVDISSDAIITALDNVNNLNLERKVILRKSDLFSKIRQCEKFDLIVSNPPYIPLSEKNNLQSEVANFEPGLALFAKDIEGVEFYQKIINTAPCFLKQNGILVFETGINQSLKIKKLLEKDFCDIKIIKDLSGIDRVISAKLK